MTEVKNSEGSKWYKWDLHCHTPIDKNWYNKPGTDAEKTQFVKDFVQKAIDEDLKVIAITDHYDYNDLKEGYLPLIQEVAKLQGLIVLPGFEITAKEGSGIHILVIFPEKMEIEVINKLLIKLHPTTRLAPPDKIPLSNQDIKGLNTLLREEVGDNYLLIFAHVDSENGILKQSTIQGANRLNIWKYEFIQFAQWSSDPTRHPERTFIGKVARGTASEYKREITNILASDCRSINPISGRNEISFLGQKFTWIKSSPSFEGLRQIFYDSENRVKIQNENPKLKNKQFFNRIKLGNNKLFSEGIVRFVLTEIPLNRDMITIIGSRGSGKSLFLHLFAKLHGIGSKFCENIDKMELDNEFLIEFCKEDGTKINSVITNPNELDYIHVSQSEVKRICEDPIAMDGTIQKLLGLPVFMHNKELDEEIEEVVDEYFSISNWFEEVDEEGNKIYLRNNNKSMKTFYNKKIKLIKTDKSREQIEKVRENQKAIFKFNKVSNELASLNEYLKKYEEKINYKVEFINSQLEDQKSIPLVVFDKQRAVISKILPNIRQKIIDLELENQKIKKFFQDSGIEDVDFKMDQVKMYESLISLHQDNLEQIKKKRLDYFKLIPRLNTIASKIGQNINSHKEIIESKWNEIKHLVLLNEEQNLIRSQLINEIEIEPVIYFNVEDFYSIIGECLNKTKFRQRGQEDSLERIRKTLNVYDFESFIDLIKNENIISLNDQSLNLMQFLEKREYFNTNTDRDFFRYLYTSQYLQKYCKVISITKFKEKKINSLSMGERGTLFLRLKLATATFSLPFIFDQPEDDLDNDFIQNDLVPLFRKIKQYRQIIISTHNANLVVNSNAEQIIIAENKEEEISYTSDGLENKEIRKKICQILEGGEEAFQKRARKYGIFHK